MTAQTCSVKLMTAEVRWLLMCGRQGVADFQSHGSLWFAEVVCVCV